MMERKKVGFLTIGQSPREDVLAEIEPLLGPRVEIIETGALDGLLLEEISGLRPEPEDFPLITRLRDKSSIVIGKRKIIPLLQAKVDELESQGIGLLALLCTENFSEIHSRGIFLMPSKILFSTVISFIKEGRIMVCVPLIEQKEYALKKWQKTGLEVIAETLNPYRDFLEKESLLERIEKEGVDLIVLDCIGYSLILEKEIASRTGKPVLLPRSALVRMIREYIH